MTDQVDKTENNSWWLIEMQGPAYMAARQLAGYEFYWTEDVNKAIRFFNREQADTVMMTIRQLRDDLFPNCLIKAPCAVEHMWIPSIG